MLIRPAFAVAVVGVRAAADRHRAGQAYWPFSEYPAATAAAVEVTFQVEPGAYWPWVARFRIGSQPRSRTAP